MPDRAEAVSRPTGLIPYKVDESTGQIVLDSDGQPELDYDLRDPDAAAALLPDRHARARADGAAGELHVGHGRQRDRVQHRLDLRHLSGLHPAAASDAHYLWVGRMATVFGIAASVATAYVAAQFNNIMDVLQLVFAFVNAPLLATFLLGMFWKRATGHGAFTGLVAGTTAAALHHGLTLPAGAVAGVKGGWLARAPRVSRARWRRTSGPRSGRSPSASW